MTRHSVVGMLLDGRCPECRHRVASHERAENDEITCSVCVAVEAQVASAVVTVGPNDHLILGFRNASPAQLEGLRESIREKHPQISDRIVIANGADTVAVIQTNGENT